MTSTDNLALLLPEASRADQDRARKVVTLLRLIVDDGRSARAASTRLTLERARSEFESHTRRRVRAALQDLVLRCLYADVGDAFAWFGEPSSSTQAAWSVLEEYREELPWLPAVPEPNEPAADLAQRLIEALARSGTRAAEVDLWRARAARARDGLERGEVELRTVCGRWLAQDEACAADALCNWVECLLDRGAVRAARQVLDEHSGLVARSPRAGRLRCWVLLLQGDEAEARALDARLPSWNGRIPAGLAELRAARRPWLPFLSGRVVGRAPKRLPDGGGARALRRCWGALVAAAFVLREAGRSECVEIDVAPALRDSVEGWLRGLDGACPDTNSPEHAAVVAARPMVVQRAAAAPLHRSLSARQVRAIAVAPIADEQGEVIGWLRLEWEHHLVPGARELGAGAALWRRRLLEERARAREESRPASFEIDWSAPSHRGPCAEAFQGLVAELAMKAAQRRWWGFEVRAGRARWVTSGGAVLDDAQGVASAQRALRRALRSSGWVRFEDPDPELSIARDSASGIVLPLVGDGELRGLLAVESARRKDFPDALAQRWLERARGWAVELRIAQFREWHRGVAGHDVHFAAERLRAAWVEHVFAAARSRSSCAIVGAPGSGKQVVARWLHFESSGPARPLIHVACGEHCPALDAPALAALESRARSGTIVLDDLERLSPDDAARLVAHLDGRRRAREAAEQAHWVVLSSTPLHELASRGTVRSDLCRRLERLQIRIPGLAERRCELPRLVSVLARRFAGEEGLAAPTFDDAAMGMLWRQAWSGNVRELENVVFKVVLLHPGREVRVDDLERLAQRFQLDFVRRVPSRAPAPEFVRDALVTTANLRGSINKTRAAMYLGWDPDTLVTRMNELGLGGDTLQERGCAAQACDLPEA